MNSFDTWYAELCSDERWHEQAAMNHKPETFQAVANKVYVNGLADADTFLITPMREHRQHVFNKVSKLPHDKVKKKWFDVPEPKEKEPEIQISEAEIKRRLAEWQSSNDAIVVNWKVAPLTARERLNQDVRPLPPDIKEPTEVQKRGAYLNHLRLAQEARVKFYREAFPDASDEEVTAYLDKFREVDNPLGI